MPKIELDVDAILTCAVPIEAEVGDKLVVMNGAVVGIIETRPRVWATMAPPPPAPPAPPKHGRPLLTQGPDVQRMALAIMDVLHEEGVQLTAHQIAVVLMRKRKETEPPHIALALSLLRRQGAILGVTKSRFPAYRLSDAVKVTSQPPAQTVNSGQAPH